MRGQIWSLPPQQLNGQPIELVAWEIADSTYILLCANWITSGDHVEVIIGEARDWYNTHQLHRGTLPSATILDHTTTEVLDAYVHSDLGTQAILIGLAAHYGIHPLQMMSLFEKWINDATETHSTT